MIVGGYSTGVIDCCQYAVMKLHSISQLKIGKPNYKISIIIKVCHEKSHKIYKAFRCRVANWAGFFGFCSGSDLTLMKTSDLFWA